MAATDRLQRPPQPALQSLQRRVRRHARGRLRIESELFAILLWRDRRILQRWERWQSLSSLRHSTELSRSEPVVSRSHRARPFKRDADANGLRQWPAAG